MSDQIESSGVICQYCKRPILSRDDVIIRTKSLFKYYPVHKDCHIFNTHVPGPHWQKVNSRVCNWKWTNWFQVFLVVIYIFAGIFKTFVSGDFFMGSAYFVGVLLGFFFVWPQWKAIFKYEFALPK